MTKHHSFRFGRRVAPVALVCAGVLGVSAAASAGLSTGTLAQAPDHPFPGTSAAGVTNDRGSDRTGRNELRGMPR
jgi:hypothetical protein